jgi:hypothetical protein
MLLCQCACSQCQYKRPLLVKNNQMYYLAMLIVSYTWFIIASFINNVMLRYLMKALCSARPVLN